MRIFEPKPLKKWVSHKFKGPGLRYEISAGNGPFPCGISCHGIFSSQLYGMIPIEEGVIADSLTWVKKCVTSTSVHGNSTIHKSARARQETVNELLKYFSSFHTSFATDLIVIKIFYAVLNITEFLFRSSDSLFEIKNNIGSKWTGYWNAYIVLSSFRSAPYVILWMI